MGIEDTTTAINPRENDIPLLYSLEQNYPNPFNPITTIRFGIPKAENVKIVVYNNIGQEVAVLLDEFMRAGYHIVHFNGTYLASAVYYYRIEAGEFVQVKKMLLVR